MLQDKLLMFSINQTVTATTDSTYYIDRDIIVNGEGKQLTVNVVVTTDFAGATGLTVGLYKTSTTASSGGTLIAETGEVPLAKLKKGTRIPIHIEIPFINPDDADNDETNLILKYTVSGTGTAGAVTAGIEYRPQTNI